MTYHRIPERLYIIMNERLKTYASGAIGLVAVAVIVGGSFAVGAAIEANAPEPRPASVVSFTNEPEPFVAPITREDEQIAIAARKAAAVEAARIEAERVAARKAAAVEAARIAAEQEAARQAQAYQTSGGGSVAPQTDAPTTPAAPAPTRCPEGTIPGAVDDAGNESMCQATNDGAQCVEYNDANECVQWYKP